MSGKPFFIEICIFGFCVPEGVAGKSVLSWDKGVLLEICHSWVVVVVVSLVVDVVKTSK